MQCSVRARAGSACAVCARARRCALPRLPKESFSPEPVLNVRVLA